MTAYVNSAQNTKRNKIVLENRTTKIIHYYSNQDVGFNQYRSKMMTFRYPYTHF